MEYFLYSEFLTELPVYQVEIGRSVKLSKTRIAILGLTFLSAMAYQPNWVYENFWSKADFYDSIPFKVPFLAFLLIYSVITTVVAELGIRFIRRYT